MFDTVIKGGTIVDGTGAPSFAGDIAVQDGVIVRIGKIDQPALATIDADGALVTPGFIDIHTHYDGQFVWDEVMEPSFSNGVTTAIAGNCGVGFAPVRDDYRKALVELMEGVEDIPGIVLDEGLDWSWKSFPEYLARLENKSFTMDVAAHLAHAPLRVFVMGKRALNHEPATDDDIRKMAQCVREAMDAGAIGVSGSRILEHLSSKGEHVPGTFAEESEMLALARAMGESGKGVFQMVPLGTGGDSLGTPASADERIEEHRRIERLAEVSGRPVTYLLHSMAHAPEEWRTLMELSEQANARGLEITPQVAARGTGLLLALDGYHIFQCRPSYMAIAHLPRAQRAEAMRDPERRRAILAEENVPAVQAPELRILLMAQRFEKVLDQYYAMHPPFDYEPELSSRLDVIAARRGCSMEEVLYDTLSADDGHGMAADFLLNYVYGSLDSVHEMLAHPQTVSGLGDGGAHLQMICDAAMTTFHLSFWSRDRLRGPTLPIEAMVHKLTGKPAKLYDLRDRGIIREGMRADINVIDFDRLDNATPEIFFDLPRGGGRLLQHGTGYLATMVNGTVTRRFDQATGAKPGRLLRAQAA